MRLFDRSKASTALAMLVMLIAVWGTAAAQEFAGREKLRAHSAEFRREVIEVTDGVWVAVGFSNANAVLIEGEGGSIIVDTTSDVGDAEAGEGGVRETFDRTRPRHHLHPRPSRPHGRRRRFRRERKPGLRAPAVRGPGAGRRTQRSRRRRPVRHDAAGRLFINAGTGLEFGRRPAPTGFLPPTRTFIEERLEQTIAGVRLHLLHTPGETRENIAVWLPDKACCCPATTSTRRFRPCYAIRGARLRPIEQWIVSLGLMLDLGADFLVRDTPGRCSAAARCATALTAYRDGIKSVLDQTVEGMRKGERPDELVQHVAFPPPLAESRTCRSSTGRWRGRSAPSMPSSPGGSTATRRSSSRCRRRTARRDWSSWPEAASRCCRGPARAYRQGVPVGANWPTTCSRSTTEKSKRSA